MALVGFSPRGDAFASVAADGHVRVWDTASGDVLVSLPGGPKALRATCLTWAGAGSAAATPLLLLGTATGSVAVVDVARGRVARTLKMPHTAALQSVAADATHLWSLDAEGAVGAAALAPDAAPLLLPPSRVPGVRLLAHVSGPAPADGAASSCVAAVGASARAWAADGATAWSAAFRAHCGAPLAAAGLSSGVLLVASRERTVTAFRACVGAGGEAAGALLAAEALPAVPRAHALAPATDVPGLWALVTDDGVARAWQLRGRGAPEGAAPRGRRGRGGAGAGADGDGEGVASEWGLRELATAAPDDGVLAAVVVGSSVPTAALLLACGDVAAPRFERAALAPAPRAAPSERSGPLTEPARAGVPPVVTAAVPVPAAGARAGPAASTALRKRPPGERELEAQEPLDERLRKMARAALEAPTADAEALAAGEVGRRGPGVRDASSVAVALAQALTTGDGELVDRCLGAASTPSAVAATVERLAPSAVLPFVSWLVGKLDASPARGTVLVPWLQAVLVHHAGQLVAAPHLASQLLALHQTVNARLGIFKKLLRLQGRIDLVLSHAHSLGRQRAGGSVDDNPDASA